MSIYSPQNSKYATYAEAEGDGWIRPKNARRETYRKFRIAPVQTDNGYSLIAYHGEISHHDPLWLDLGDEQPSGIGNFSLASTGVWFRDEINAANLPGCRAPLFRTDDYERSFDELKRRVDAYWAAKSAVALDTSRASAEIIGAEFRAGHHQA